METKGKKKTIEELAGEIGISSRQLSTNLADGCPRGSVEAIKNWRARNIRSRTKPDGELQIALLRAQLGVERQREIKMKAENTIMKNTLVEKRVVLEDLKAVRDMLDNRLASLPSEITEMIPGEIQEETEKKVKNTIQMVLKELADFIDQYNTG